MSDIIDESIKYYAVYCKNTDINTLYSMLYDIHNNDRSYDTKFLDCYDKIGYTKMIEIAKGLNKQQMGGSEQKIDKYISSISKNTDKFINTTDDLASKADKLANTTDRLASSASKIINVFKKKKNDDVEQLKQIIISKDKEILLLKQQLLKSK